MLEAQDINHGGVFLIILLRRKFRLAIPLGVQVQRVCPEPFPEWPTFDQRSALLLWWCELGVLPRWRTMVCKCKELWPAGCIALELYWLAIF